MAQFIRTGRAARCAGYPRGSFPSASAVTSAHTRASFSVSGFSVMQETLTMSGSPARVCGEHTGGYPPRDRLNQFALVGGVHERVREGALDIGPPAARSQGIVPGCAPSPNSRIPYQTPRRACAEARTSRHRSRDPQPRASGRNANAGWRIARAEMVCRWRCPSHRLRATGLRKPYDCNGVDLRQIAIRLCAATSGLSSTAGKSAASGRSNDRGPESVRSALGAASLGTSI